MFVKSSTLVTLAATAATLLSTPSFVHAKLECDTSLGTFYPYCINIPDGASGGQKFPTIVFLSGSGARGDPSRVRELVSISLHVCPYVTYLVYPCVHTPVFNPSIFATLVSLERKGSFGHLGQIPNKGDQAPISFASLLQKQFAAVYVEHLR